jgi:GDP-L-fucose synthase
LIRKIYLGKCLEEGNWNAIHSDLKKRPVFFDEETVRMSDFETRVRGSEGARERMSERMKERVKEDYLLKILSKYGIRVNSSEFVKFVAIDVWGSGKPMREFLWSEEMADACVYIMERVNFEDLKPKTSEIRNVHINIGTGKEISIQDLAELIKEKVGFKGSLVFDASKPDGTMRKLTDPAKLHTLGWHHSVEIAEGIEKLYNWYITH